MVRLSKVVPAALFTVLAASLLPACQMPCQHLLDCPSGEMCSPDAVCVPAPPPPALEPITCVPGGDSAFLQMETGFTVGASSWDCPPLRAMNAGSPTVSLEGFGTAVNGGSLTLQAVVSNGSAAAGRWLYYGVVGDVMFARQLTPEEAFGFPVELFLSPAATGTGFSFFMAIDDGTGSPEEPHPVNLARLRVNLIQVQGGDIQVSITWDNDNDVDLHLFTPDSVEIYYGNTQPNGTNWGQLDLDSNVGCVTTDPRNENIFFPSGSAIDGEYRVVVDLFSGCTETTHFRVTVLKRAVVADVVDGTLLSTDPGARNREVSRLTWP